MDVFLLFFLCNVIKTTEKKFGLQKYQNTLGELRQNVCHTLSPLCYFLLLFCKPFPASRVTYILHLLNLNLLLSNPLQFFYWLLIILFIIYYFIDCLTLLFSVFMLSFKANIKLLIIIHIFCVSNTLMLIFCVKIYSI